MGIEAFKNQVFILSERIYPMVARYLGNDSDAKDAIQEVMIKLWEQRDKLNGHPNLNGYVFLTARNHCLDLLKKKKPNIVSNGHDSNFIKVEASRELEFRELQDVIQKILKQCPVKHSEVLILRDIDGLEYEEIAMVTYLKVTHVRVILSRTRKYVQHELQKYYAYEYGK